MDYYKTSKGLTSRYEIFNTPMKESVRESINRDFNKSNHDGKIIISLEYPTA